MDDLSPIPLIERPAPWQRYAAALISTGVALLLSLFLRPLVVSNPFLFFFAAVAFSAWYGGFEAGLLTILLTVLATNYFLLPPLYSLALGPNDLFRLLIFTLIAGFISLLSEQRYRAQLQAQSERARLQVTLASIGDGVIATDREGRVSFINAVAEELTGWTAHEALGCEVAEIFRIINAESRQPVEAPVARVLREGRTIGLANHTRLIARDGAERAIDDSGAPIRNHAGKLIGTVLVFRDVTGRERADAERLELLLREQAARTAAERARERAAFLSDASRLLAGSLDYAVTLRQVADLIVPKLADWCVVDLLDKSGAIQMVAAAHSDPERIKWAYELRERYPVDPDGPAGAPYVIRTGAPQLYSDISDQFLQSVARTNAELRLLLAVGYRSIMIVPLQARGRILGALSFVIAESERRFGSDDLVFAQDVADRAAVAIDNARLYEAERQARTASEEAVHQRNLFLSVASHELRTPLTSLLLQVQLLQRRIGRDSTLAERDQRGLQVVANQSRRLDRMIAALLDVSRLELGQLSLKRGTVNLGELIRRVVAEAQLTSDEHPISCELPAEELVIEGDELRLEQVFQNLLQNAIKYSPRGGPVRVWVVEDELSIGVAVQDHGIGIPEEALPHLFKRFFRASNADPRQISGMGIGLFIIKEVVSLHGGSVAVESREGAGTTFTVYLPRFGAVPAMTDGSSSRKSGESMDRGEQHFRAAQDR